VAYSTEKDANMSPELEERNEIATRLNRVAGQVAGIRRMIEQGRPCVETLQQLAAAEAAVMSISSAVFKCHVRNLTDGVPDGEAANDVQLGELRAVLDRFRQ